MLNAKSPASRLVVGSLVATLYLSAKEFTAVIFVATLFTLVIEPATVLTLEILEATVPISVASFATAIALFALAQKMKFVH